MKLALIAMSFPSHFDDVVVAKEFDPVRHCKQKSLHVLNAILQFNSFYYTGSAL